MYTQSRRREFMNREVEEVEVEVEVEVEEEEEDNDYDQGNVGEEENRREGPAPLFETVPRPDLSWCAGSRANSRG